MKQAGSAVDYKGVVRACQAAPVSRRRGDWTRLITVQVKRWADVVGIDHEQGCTSDFCRNEEKRMVASRMLYIICDIDVGT